MPIKDLPPHLRPQEKALMYGIDSLSELEILALVLRAGSFKSDALQMSSNLLQKFGTVKNIFDAPLEKLQKVKGIGKVKSLQIIAISKIFRSFVFDMDLINSPHNSLSQMIDFAHSHISNFTRENFLVVCLGRNDEVIYFESMYKGTQKEVPFSPKEIVSLAITKNATKFYCVHNHPSEITVPSENDIKLTKQLSYISQLFGLNFVTHLIINSKKDYHSIKW